MMVVVSNCNGVILSRVEIKHVISKALLVRRLLDEIPGHPCDELTTNLGLNLVDPHGCGFPS